MAVKDKAPSLIDLLSKATAADLANLDQQIAEKESALAEATKNLEADLASLKALRKVIDVKLNGKPERKKPVRKAKGSVLVPQERPAYHNGDSVGHEEAGLASKIVGLITRDGPLSPQALAIKLGRSPQGINMSVTKMSSMFKRLSDGRIALPNHEEDED